MGDGGNFASVIIPVVIIVVVAFGVLIVVRAKMKKNMEETNKPTEIAEMEMQELIAKAKADMEKEKAEEENNTEEPSKDGEEGKDEG
jgi:flagellar biosynthesis/type III secretory pathway M-ring protein FliF/YscJ